MKNFISAHQVENVEHLVQKAIALKKEPLSLRHLGEGKTIGLLFFNPSLRTRVSSQKAAFNLGANAWVINSSDSIWKIEYSMGGIMNEDKAENLKDLVQVLNTYCDILGVRVFPELKNREDDYSEKLLTQIMQYSQKPVVSLESATRHPLQSFADILTIYEKRKSKKTKVVLTWAPHVSVLPQAVSNSFAEWCSRVEDIDLVITHPEGYELSEEFTQGAKIVYDRNEAFRNADFIYAKNWSSYNDYGQTPLVKDSWTVDKNMMDKTNNAFFMHCLPVRRNLIVTDEVIDSPNSLILQQAENRIYSAQTVFSEILKNNV